LVTIKDVAKLAGVSISTASYALNNSNKVSEKTREKVLKAAKELNYIPNKFAQNLKKLRTDLIALIVHEINGPFYDKLVQGILDVAHILGYNLVIFCESGHGRPSSLVFLKEKIFNGAIIMTPVVSNDDIKELVEENIPLVLLDRKLEEVNVCSVLIDNEKGAFEAVRHLIELNHRKIGFISGPPDSYDNKERYKGFVKAMEKFGLKVYEDLIIQGNFTEESGYKAMKEFISRKKGEMPTAFFSSNDEMAIGAMKALQEEGFKIPDHISIVGFDDINLAQYVQPKLTTVRRPMYELGSFSAHMLINTIKGRLKYSNITLDVELILRESTRKV